MREDEHGAMAGLHEFYERCTILIPEVSQSIAWSLFSTTLASYRGRGPNQSGWLGLHKGALQGGGWPIVSSYVSVARQRL